MFDPAIRTHQIRDALCYWLVIPAAVIASGKAIDILLGLPDFSSGPLRMVLTGALFPAGLILIFLSMKDLSDGGGTPNPRRPPKKLVTARSYSLCRHPMFLGYDLCALAVVLWFRSPGMLLISFPVFLLLQIRFLRKEEKILRGKFRQHYTDYAARTPFLLPRPRRMQFWPRQDAKK
ncbi:MAG: isoprenylcysteine carboxylmethyltransferase family protein [Desulfobulbus sp.]|nr:MAG: isoprenylcysteine carboxylmethyltransferase family protein [Desulfobulbus sp.]